MTINRFKQEGLSDEDFGFCTSAAGRSLGGVRTGPSCGGLVRQWLPADRQSQLSAWTAVCAGQRRQLGNGSGVFPQRQDHPATSQTLAGLGLLPAGLEAAGREVRR